MLERRGKYDEYVGMKLLLKNSYMDYRFLAIETTDKSKSEFIETFVSTYDLSQNANEKYTYRIAGFLLKPNTTFTEFEILDLPKDGFTHLNCILGIN